jgi:hypothetical protein
LDLIETVLDSLPRWLVSCLILAVLLIPGAEPAVMHWVQREAVSEVRSEFESLMPRSTHRDDGERRKSVPVNLR